MCICSKGVAILSLLLLAFPKVGYTQIYRCQGAFYSIPCNKVTARLKRTGSTKKASLKKVSYTKHRLAPLLAPRFSIPQHTFRKLSDGRGIWRTWIKGSGVADIWLDLYNHGVRSTRRYIGRVALSRGERPVRFTYLSSLKGFSDSSLRYRFVVNSVR